MDGRQQRPILQRFDVQIAHKRTSFTSCTPAERTEVQRSKQRGEPHDLRLLRESGLEYDGNGFVPGAQTESRRAGSTGPVRGLLGGKTSPAAFQKATRTFTRQEAALLVCLRSAVSGQKYSMSPNTSSSLVEAWLWLIRVPWTRTAPPAL